MVNIEVVVNAAKVEATLARLQVALSAEGLTEFLTTSVDPYLKSRAGARFAREGDDVVGKWAPLKEATEFWRMRKGYGRSHPINKRTGALEDYITKSDPSVIPGTSSATLVFPGGQASGELAKKLRTAQRGDKRTVPRPVLGMNEKDLAYVLDKLSRHLIEVMM